MKMIAFVLFLSVLTALTCDSIGVVNQLLAYLSTQPTKQQFKLWHYFFKRPYELNSELALQKYRVFKQNLKFIEKSNGENKEYTLGVGPFTDLTWEEFSNTYLFDVEKLGAPINETPLSTSFDILADLDDNNDDMDDIVKEELTNTADALIVSVDYKDLHKYTKDQHECGSCWAFAAVASFEAQFILSGFVGYTFSEQELVDCSANTGCKGGLHFRTFKYILDNGLAFNEEYPYENQDNFCRKHLHRRGIVTYKEVYKCSLFNYESLTTCTPQLIAEWLKFGPVSTYIQVKEGLQHYRSGNWIDDTCDHINHAVETLYISYNPTSKTGVGRIRNSWSENWGEKGTATISFVSTQILNGCGMLDFAFQPRSIDFNYKQ